MLPSAFETVVPTTEFPPATPFTCNVTPVLLVPVTRSPRFSELFTRTSVPFEACSTNFTCPGATCTDSVFEFADPGSGLLTSSGKVPGFSAGITAANCVLETNVVATALPFQFTCAPYTNCDPLTRICVGPSGNPDGFTLSITGIGFQIAIVADPCG